MKVCEIFTSIQGESGMAGMLSTFIRFTGCNLRCSYCDTTYSYEGGIEMGEDEIINEVTLVGVNLVTVTGGEPLLQEGVHTLIERLLNEGHSVMVETNGSMSIKDIDVRASIVLDVKTPLSGMNDEMDVSNLDFIKPTDEIRFVIQGRSDYDWARNYIDEHRLMDKCAVYFSPAFGKLEAKTLAKWMLKDRLDVRFNLQMQKYIFGPEERGV